jgi:hypothetical protein
MQFDPATRKRVRQVFSDALSAHRRSGKARKRHPAEVTSDRLLQAVTKYEGWTPEERDMVGIIRNRLELIAQQKN